MKFLFKFYRTLLSPLLHGFSRIMSGHPYGGCKFEPTCSVYCEQALHQHGWIRGGLKATKRILKCHPLSTARGYDPV